MPPVNNPDASTSAPLLQAVCVKWGTKYGVDEVNRLSRAINRHASVPVRFICVTDEPDDAYDPGIELKPFPTFALPFDEMKRGCRLKLAVFSPGLLDPDVPAMLFDLDAAVLGDVARIAEQIERKPALYLLNNQALPLWRVQRRFRRFLGERYYAGNSSVVAFMPGEFGTLFDDFNRLVGSFEGPVPKRLQTDERFISYAARDRLRVHSRRLAMKFHWEFMVPFAFLETLRRRLPWVARRRRRLVAIAFEGESLKPWMIAAAKPGDVFRYRKLFVRWAYPDLSSYWGDAGSESGSVETFDRLAPER